MPIRTGAQYVESLRDGREVWVSGAKADDVPSHPAFAGVVQSFAAAYDLQRAPEHEDVLTEQAPDGDGRVSLAFRPPRTAADLTARRRMAETFHRQSGGIVGRLPEYGSSVGVGL